MLLDDPADGLAPASFNALSRPAAKVAQRAASRFESVLGLVTEAAGMPNFLAYSRLDNPAEADAAAADDVLMRS